MIQLKIAGDVELLRGDPRWYKFLPGTHQLNYFSPGGCHRGAQSGWFTLLLFSKKKCPSPLDSNHRKHHNARNTGCVSKMIKIGFDLEITGNYLK